MKTSVSSYSFAYWLDQGVETQFSLIEKVKAYGFEAIEFTDLMPPDGVSEAAYAEMLREEAARVGLAISGYSVGADLMCEDVEAELERLRQKVDVAVLLGTKQMRHDATFRTPPAPLGFDNVVGMLADRCRAITEYAAGKGIFTMVENHGFFCQDSDRMEKLVNAVAHPNFGLQVDVGNFLCVDENPATAVGRIAPYAHNAHVKDFLVCSGESGAPGGGFIHTRGGQYIRGTVIGHGAVPIKTCVGALKRVGYDGYLTLEFEGPERLDYAIPEALAYLKTLI